MENVKIDMKSDGLVELWYKYLKVWKFDYFMTQNCKIVPEEIGRDVFINNCEPYSFKHFCERLNDENYIMYTDALNDLGIIEEFKFSDIYGK